MRKLTILTIISAALVVAAGAYQPARADGSTITGTVKFDGPAPAAKQIEVSKDKDVCGLKAIYNQDLMVGSDGGIQYAIVSLTDAKGAVTPETVKFDQKGCQYQPHVLAFPAGSTVQVVNSDGILHNIHTYSTKNPSFNMAQPKFKKVITVTGDQLSQPELIKVTCDAHGWMKGWWFVAGNPYYAVTDDAGHYTIKDVPPGDYTIEAWQEKLGTTDQKVSVKAGAPATVDFALKPK
jgi:plastocyanin